MRTLVIAFSLLLPLSVASAEEAATTPEESSGLGLQAGVGTDVTLGAAGFVGVSRVLGKAGDSRRLELGGQLYYHRSEWEDTEGINDYFETTTVTVLAARANLLYGYQPAVSRMFWILGTGIAAVSMSWEERSPTDVSLGTPLDGGGSKQSDDGVAGALIANAGIGLTFGSGLEGRLQLPLLIFFGTPGEASSIAPTLTASLGYRF